MAIDIILVRRNRGLCPICMKLITDENYQTEFKMTKYKGMDTLVCKSHYVADSVGS